MNPPPSESLRLTLSRPRLYTSKTKGGGIGNQTASQRLPRSRLADRARQIGLDAEVRAAPRTKRLHEGYKFFTLAVQGIADLRWYGGTGLARDNPVGLQLAQLLGQNLVRDLWNFPPDLRKPARSRGKMPKDLHLPLAG